MGQHVRVQHHLHHDRRRRVRPAAGPEEERALARPVPDHHGPPRPRSGRHRPVHRERPAGPRARPYWLYIHVSTAILCGAVFYVGAVGTILYLFKDSYESKLARGGKPGGFATSVLERLPASASLDKFSYRINAAVFPLWTFTIIAGAIWAGDAWGRYWGWDPKETWSFITWVAYACYLHARATAGWKGRKAAYLALAAFGCWLFNYYGVNIFVSGKHSYADVGMSALTAIGF
ncbi:Cytochrome c biogenesis protein CcsA [Streptomyces hirsutus]